MKALESPSTTSKLVLECKSILNNLAQLTRVTLLWVPGHKGIDGNEEADALAKRGADLLYIGPEPVMGLPASVGKSLLLNAMELEANKLWINRCDCRQAKELMGLRMFRYTKTHSNPLNDILSYKRRDLSRLVGVLSGHATLNRHLTTIRIRNDANCQMCLEEVEETSAHYLCECPAFSNIRAKIFGVHQLQISDLQQTVIHLIASFIRKTAEFESSAV